MQGREQAFLLFCSSSTQPALPSLFSSSSFWVPVRSYSFFGFLPACFFLFLVCHELLCHIKCCFLIIVIQESYPYEFSLNHLSFLWDTFSDRKSRKIYSVLIILSMKYRTFCTFVFSKMLIFFFFFHICSVAFSWIIYLFGCSFGFVQLNQR